MYVCEVRESVHTKSTGPLSPVTLHIQRTGGNNNIGLYNTMYRIYSEIIIIHTILVFQARPSYETRDTGIVRLFHCPRNLGIFKGN